MGYIIFNSRSIVSSRSNDGFHKSGLRKKPQQHKLKKTSNKWKHRNKSNRLSNSMKTISKSSHSEPLTSKNAKILEKLGFRVNYNYVGGSKRNIRYRT